MDASQHEARLRILGSALPSDLGAGAAALRQHEDGEEITPEHEAEAIRLHTMLEVAFLAAAADGEFSEDEIRNLSANLQAWLQSELSAEFLGEVSRYKLKVGQTFVVADEVHYAGEPVLAPGAAVQLGIDPGQVRFLPT